jgi:hypothetical protein
MPVPPPEWSARVPQSLWLGTPAQNTNKLID